MNVYEMLGRQYVGEVAADLVGAGFDWSTLVNAGAEAANQGIKYKQDQDASAAGKAKNAAAAQKSIAADANWASAEQQLDLATQSHDPSRIGPAQALQMQAMSVAMSAGSGLAPDAQNARAAAAQKAASNAAQAALSSPSDQAKQALSRAWQKVSAAAAAGGSSGDTSSSTALVKASSGGNWLTDSHAGIPGWGWIVGGGIVTTGVVLIVRSLLKR